jgi:hypothetical protein
MKISTNTKIQYFVIGFIFLSVIYCNLPQKLNLKVIITYNILSEIVKVIFDPNSLPEKTENKKPG